MSELRALVRELNLSCEVDRDRRRFEMAVLSVSNWSVKKRLERLAKVDAGILASFHGVIAGVTWRVSLISLAAFVACSSTAATSDYVVVRQFPHDTAAYTQGLVYDTGWLYESTGRLGRSQLRRVNLTTGQVETAVSLPPDRFGEGLALLDEKLYQLTWKSGLAYVYDAQTLARVDSFTYSGEGWGLATDGTSLIMSDGSATLRFRDPQSFEVLREVRVEDNGLPLTQINELEYVRGELFANVYQSDWIVKIDPSSGEVLQWIDFAGLLASEQRTTTTDVLNGIAFDKEAGHLLLTGKLWPAVFAIRLRAPLGDDTRQP